MNCALGHSMGGGCAILAASMSPVIKTMATLASNETKPSVINAASRINNPALIIAGEDDCITLPARHQIPIYESLRSNFKTYPSIVGGTHCQMADRNFLCNSAEGACRSRNSITRMEHHAIINHYLVLWLNAELKKDSLSARQFDYLIKRDSAIRFKWSSQLSRIIPGIQNPF